MAKTGFWLRGAKGKLAGTTMYKDPTTGETIMREVVTPSNPKTDAQMVQRVIMATVGSAYSLTKDITDHSFEGMKAGRETMSYFMKQNVLFCREKIASMLAQGLLYDDIFNFIKVGEKGFVPNQYQLSMGSLPKVDASILAKSLGGVSVQNVGLVQPIKENTYQAVINALGLKRGDQLTFISVEQVAIADSEFKFCRVILDPTDPSTKEPAALSTAFLDANGKINAPSVRNEGNFTFAISASGLEFKPSLLRNDSGITGCAVIVSRKVGDAWNRSTSYLAYNEGAGYSLGDAVEAAKAGVQTDLYTPSQLYLNNAGEGGGVAAQSGSDSGSGSQPVVSAQLTDATVNEVACVQGSTKSIVVASDATAPYAGEIIVHGNSAAEGKQVTIENTAGQEIANGKIEYGVAEINGSFQFNVTYNVKLAGAATGFSFNFNKANGGGGNSDE